MAFVVPTAESMFSNHEDAHFPSSSSSAPQDLRARTSMSCSGLDRPEDDVSDYGCQLLGEKKIRRLNVEQVKALEKSFELGNKLGPEKKMLLSRALGLQPKQIAIWFQNRRARRKTKQLEKDYDVLKRQIQSLKADNDALKSQNKKLQSQLLALKVKNRESADENSCNININAMSTDNLIYHHSDNKNADVFASSVGPQAGTLTRLLHSSSRPDHQFQGPAHEPFCNIFSGLEENHHSWLWPEQQTFF